jgi:hypothetical protein
MIEHVNCYYVSIEIVCQCCVICRSDKYGQIYSFGKKSETCSVHGIGHSAPSHATGYLGLLQREEGKGKEKVE